MKKRVAFLALLLLGLIFFACEFNIPKAVEFKGKPTVRFRQTVPVGEKFTSILADEIKKKQDESEVDDMTIFLCNKTEIFTDLIHMKLFDQDFDVDDNDPVLPELPNSDLGNIFDDLVDQGNIDLDDKLILIKSEEPMEVPLSSIGTLLEGFEFHGHQIKLYFDGSNIIKNAKMNIYFDTIIDGVLTPVKYYEDVDVPEGQSDFDNWIKSNGYTDTNPPTGGFPIDIRLNGEDISVSYEVYIPAGVNLSLTDLQNGHIKIEVVVWLPFEFKAVGEDGATISFPDDALFSSENDLFGRDKPDADNIMTDIIQSLNLEIKFDKNPFKKSTLIITSKGIELENKLKDDNSFPFIVSEEDMKKINSPGNWPFTPNFKMKFSKDDILKLPSEFSVTEFIFNAKIKYRVDF
jgi:hypothetical protein